MKLNISKSKNSESFYIAKSYINDKGVSTSVIVRKLGTFHADRQLEYHQQKIYQG